MKQSDLKYGGWTNVEVDEELLRDPLGRTHEELMEKAEAARHAGDTRLHDLYRAQAKAEAHRVIQRPEREPNRYIINRHNKLVPISGQDFNPKGQNGRKSKRTARPPRGLRR
jgi:hypothetical protein